MHRAHHMLLRRLDHGHVRYLGHDERRCKANAVGHRHGGVDIHDLRTSRAAWRIAAFNRIQLAEA